MKRFIKTGILLSTLAASVALLAIEARAQESFTGRRAQTVLVSPQGELLDYTPESGEVQVRMNGQGQRVLIDSWGSLIATEIPAEVYFSSIQRDSFGDTPDAGYETGSVPENTSVSRQPLEEQPFPDPLQDNGQAAPDFGSLDEQPAQPAIQQNKEPVITLKNKSRSEIVALQVFLDRQGASPGVIDGKMGTNVTKALIAWESISGETIDPNNTEDILERLRLSGGMPVISYEITPADAAGPYVAEIPEDYSQKALLPGLNFTSQAEMLAERFHMDEAFLRELNPGADFSIPGTVIKVINPGDAITGEVARIVADKGRKQVFAYGADGALIAAYPASIGSSDTPSPSGTVTVERVALNPGYTYNPKINFQQGENDKVLHIPPGPNGPVGTVWMALSKPTYGIHGTPEPSKIGRTQSHGCIRLTNWDATELAKMVKPGVTVEFVD